MRSRRIRTRAILSVLLVLMVLVTSNERAVAQYGGVSGLFVTTSPAKPGFADFTGLGCAGGVEVVLYLPGVQPAASDPSATQSVPGRILAVTTSVSSLDALENGTFAFPDVQLPTDLEPGVYEVHSRCGDLDMRVLVQLTSDGVLTIDPDPNAPIVNQTPDGIPEALPFTGRNANRTLSFAAGLIAVGISLAAVSRRPSRTS